jgi:hypothetical protein
MTSLRIIPARPPRPSRVARIVAIARCYLGAHRLLHQPVVRELLRALSW